MELRLKSFVTFLGLITLSSASLAALPPGEITILCHLPDQGKLQSFAVHLPEGFGSYIDETIATLDPLNLLNRGEFTDALLTYNSEGNAEFSLNGKQGAEPRPLLFLMQLDLSSTFDAVLSDMESDNNPRTGRCFGVLDPNGEEFKKWRTDPNRLGQQ